MQLEELKYPIGKYKPNKEPSPEQLKEWIGHIESFPEQVEQLLASATLEMLSWRYRPEGWTIQQLVHHCADSHMNSLIRFKLALTEEEPTIKPYDEGSWAVLPDTTPDALEASLLMIKGIHKRWGLLLHSLTIEQLQRSYIHPEHGKKFNLAETVGMYAWHCDHHLAHMQQAIHSKGKY